MWTKHWPKVVAFLFLTAFFYILDQPTSTPPGEEVTTTEDAIVPFYLPKDSEYLREQKKPWDKTCYEAYQNTYQNRSQKAPDLKQKCDEGFELVIQEFITEREVQFQACGYGVGVALKQMKLQFLPKDEVEKIILSVCHAELSR